MCASFTGNPCAIIDSCNTLINATDETDFTTFYCGLSPFVWHILIIGGEMNTQIYKYENNKYCFHNPSNKYTYGEYHPDFSLDNIIACINNILF